MNQVDVVRLLKDTNAELTRVKAKLAAATEAVAAWPLGDEVGVRQSPAKVCEACGEKLGHGHAEGCPRLPVAA